MLVDTVMKHLHRLHPHIRQLRPHRLQQQTVLGHGKAMPQRQRQHVTVGMKTLHGAIVAPAAGLRAPGANFKSCSCSWMDYQIIAPK